MSTTRAAIPKVDRVLRLPAVTALLAEHPRPLVVAAVRTVLAELRLSLAAAPTPLPDDATLASHVATRLRQTTTPSLRRVVNGTGVVIHTNLGRACLPPSLLPHLATIACHYSNLEFDLASGQRGSRYQHVEPLLCELTGAEAALVVNNNAAAVLLVLAGLAAGREVVVSRGELVEIGGSFRIPEVMAQSGAILREVGTTNRTHPGDYRRAVTPQTAALLKVHTSNFAMLGFTASVSPARLASIGRELGVPVLADVGSGTLLDTRQFGLSHEPTVSDYLQAGVDLVTCSGDKLLGGPQVGIILGRRELLAPLKGHPLLRALRVDKLTLAALEVVLACYRDPRQALAQLPTLQMLAATPQALAAKARRYRRRLAARLPATVHLTVAPGMSQVGGGALPGEELATSLLAVVIPGLSASRLEELARTASQPVLGLIRNDQYLLDVRTLADDDLPLLVATLAAAALAAESR